MSVVWKASGVCILSPKCPVSLLQVDSWALGVLLYTLIYGTMPFDGFDHKNLIRQISSGEYREPTQPSGACPMRECLVCLPQLTLDLQGVTYFSSRLSSALGKLAF